MGAMMQLYLGSGPASQTCMLQLVSGRKAGSLNGTEGHDRRTRGLQGTCCRRSAERQPRHHQKGGHKHTLDGKKKEIKMPAHQRFFSS